MAVTAVAASVGYIIGKLADNKTSLLTSIVGGYACSQGHNHRNEDERIDCDTTTRESQTQNYDLKKKQTKLEDSRYQNEYRFRLTESSRTFRMKMVVYIFGLLTVLLIVSAAIAIGILWGKGILKFR